tara:strand:+ start:171 stop:404 length:234 start_codon:yes stop_codon:yes gene_type:complete
MDGFIFLGLSINLLVFIVVGLMAHFAALTANVNKKTDNLDCPHHTKADVVTDYTCTLERIEVWCLDCGQKLSEHIDV